jgi:hypothetical protein
MRVCGICRTPARDTAGIIGALEFVFGEIER